WQRPGPQGILGSLRGRPMGNSVKATFTDRPLTVFFPQRRGQRAAAHLRGLGKVARDPGPFIFGFPFVGLGEEPGWRGFALPELMRRRSALAAASVVDLHRTLGGGSSARGLACRASAPRFQLAGYATSPGNGPEHGRSVTIMCPGACVIANGKRAASTASWGVTPQPQKTGTSPSCTVTASP